MENNNKQTWSPITFANVDPKIIALGTKSSEEKLYLILYIYKEDGDSFNSFELCQGRIECARTIERIILDHNVDIHNSVIMVEIPAINAKGDAEWVMKNPDRSMTIYQFAKSFSMHFSDDFDIEEYNYQNHDQETQSEITAQDISNAMNVKTVRNEADVFEGSQEMADAYREAMKDQ